jgi:hypothetical protein
MLSIDSVYSTRYQITNTATSVTAKKIVVTSSGTPRLSVRLSVISVPTMLTSTTASQDAGHVAVPRQLDRHHRDQQCAHDPGGVGQTEMQVHVQGVRRGFADGRGQDLDDPEVDVTSGPC